MITINGREATSQEIADIAGALYAKADLDDKAAENCEKVREMVESSTHTDKAAACEGYTRLALTFRHQAERERKLAQEIEE